MSTVAVSRSSAATVELTEGQSVNLDSFAAPEIFACDQDDRPPGYDQCWSAIVISENNPFRVSWSIIIFVLLAYTASVYLYRFCFCSFHIGPDGLDPLGEDDAGWNAINLVVDVIFWGDLVLGFFFSYRNNRGYQVVSMKLIACQYLKGLFWVNLLACMPESFGEAVMSIFMASSSGNFDFRVARISRLQRISRLSRLMRLTRLIKCLTARSKSPFMSWFQSLRGVRIVNFICGLVWSVHLIACGWYLCAALQNDVNETWVARRARKTTTGASLLEAPPAEQWLHSMYFVLTVFTTVGFGDISAGTEVEILYVAFTMLAGAVVHSIIISEVIQVVTSTDKVQEFTDQQLSLVEAYSEHTILPWESQSLLKDEIKYRARTQMTSSTFDKEAMKELITGKNIPRWLLGSLPAKLFGGKLLNNELLRGDIWVPPRLPCLLAVHLRQSEFEAGEILYQVHDFPFNLFLVIRGTFAYVASPRESGGMDMALDSVGSTAQLAKKASPGGNSRAAIPTPKGGLADPTPSRSWLTTARRMSTGHVDEHPDSKDSHDQAQATLFPYRLSGCHSYFGDVEIIRSRPRLTTMRCETPLGMALVLHKQDFTELKDQFPQFGALWQYAVRRREWSRVKQLKALTRGLPYRAFASVQIQTWWRAVSRRLRDTPRRSPRREGQRDEEVTVMPSVARTHLLNAQAARIMDRQDRGGAGEDVHERLDGMRKDLDGLRADMQAVLRALDVKPTGSEQRASLRSV